MLVLKRYILTMVHSPVVKRLHAAKLPERLPWLQNAWGSQQPGSPQHAMLHQEEAYNGSNPWPEHTTNTILAKHFTLLLAKQ